MSWIGVNYGILIVVLTQFALLVRDHVKLQDLISWQEKIQQRLDEHISNDHLHMTDRAWEDLTRRLESLEKKLDLILLNERKIIRNQKGDTDATQ